eukprot:CAMPEP_0197599064 /NCGR_PEP_ID=MMETSP1326-20131121/30606_1 /TAXON_ID=1155430 /ORGANISM="Genus nov. species nov., Strain RCC2288" /LENGTH=98 /DNA_ID=CAMNT_0043165965 /DNA_START=1 /DNA_END=297 /DNA_ORIENTATION=-
MTLPGQTPPTSPSEVVPGGLAGLTEEEKELQAFLEDPDGDGHFEQRANAAAVRIQAAARGNKHRREFTEKKEAITKIQSAHRGRQARKEVQVRRGGGH